MDREEYHAMIERTDRDLETLAAEALGIARRMHADYDRLGEILFGDFTLEERWRFEKLYFGLTKNLTDLDHERCEDLWGWGIMYGSGGDGGVSWPVPPLPLMDEIERDLADEFG